MRSLAPWLWFLDFDGRGKALDASDLPTVELAIALKAHFAEVHVLRADGANLDAVRVADNRAGYSLASMVRGSIQTAYWPPETFDCVVLHDALVRRCLTNTEVLAELRAAHRLLKRGGWLAIASRRPPGLFRRRARMQGVPRAVLARLLRRARFREIRCLFADPSAEEIFTVVPDVRAAILAHETLASSSGRISWRRRAAAALGLRSALFSAYVLLARA